MLPRVVAVWLSVLLVAATPFSPAFAEAPQPAPTAPNGPTDALAAHQVFWKAYRERNLWAVSQLWDVSDEKIAAAFPASGKFSVGWGNIEESFRRSFAHNRDIKIDVRDLKVIERDNYVWIVSAVRFEAVQTQTGQFVVMDRMLTSELYRRKGDTWKLVHYHANYPGFRSQPENPATMLAAAYPPAEGAETIKGARDRFIAAFTQKNIGEIFDLFASDKDVVAIHPTSPIPFLGPENVVASWKKTFDDIEALTVEPMDSNISEDGDTAVVSELSQYHIAFKQNPSEILHFHNVLTTYLLRKEAGQWKIALYHAHLGFAFDGHEH